MVKPTFIPLTLSFRQLQQLHPMALLFGSTPDSSYYVQLDTHGIFLYTSSLSAPQLQDISDYCNQDFVTMKFLDDQWPGFYGTKSDTGIFLNTTSNASEHVYLHFYKY